MSFVSWMRKRISTRSKRWDGFQIRPTAPRFRPRLEALEDRWLPSTLTVTNNLNVGPGSLRADIAAAQSGDTIVFAPHLDGQTIPVWGELAIRKSLTIKGPGAGLLTLNASNSDPFGNYVLSRVFDVARGVQVTLSGMTITQGHGAVGGGMIGPYDGYGGGIVNLGTLTISACTISNSHTSRGGGGIANFGTLTVSQCTLSGNSAYSFGRGGAFYNTAGGLATLTNCTLSYNSASYGGGVFVDANTTITLTNCTVANNSSGGGIDVMSGGILNLTNTIVAGNTGPDIYGAVATADHNLVGNATGSSGIVNGVNGNIVGGNGNPMINADLGPMQNNGGRTQTMALLAGSPAIGHGNNATAPATDQRGVTRLDLAGETTDIGAFEL